MSFFETNLDPDEVVTAAVRMAGVPEDLRNTISAIASQIRSVNVEAACGDDEPGRTLLEAYNGSNGTGGSASEDILSGSEEICGHIYTLAANTGISAIESELQDEQSAARIEQLVAELRGHDLTPALLQDQGTVEQISEVQSRIEDPGAAEVLGQDQVAEIQGWLDEVDRLAE